jgi:hypothetical protein
LRQAAQRLLQLVLHLHLRDVGVGAGFEGQRDAAAALFAVRGQVDQSVEALHRLLDHLRDRLLDRGGRGARVAGIDRDLRWRDVGVLLDRQLVDGEHAGHMMIAITHAKIGRSMKKRDMTDQRVAASPAGTARTTSPALTFCRPSTMSRSPAARPAVTSH